MPNNPWDQILKSQKGNFGTAMMSEKNWVVGSSVMFLDHG